jgi:subtilisin-like proprotein convertase family protein
MNMPLPLTIRITLAAIVIVGGLAIIHRITQFDAAKTTGGDSARPSAAHNRQAAHNTVAAFAKSQPRPTDGAVATRGKWQAADQSSGGSSYTLALDQAMLRGADGKDALMPLDPPATLESLPQRLAVLAASPVAYLADQPRSAATRRIVTQDLRVRLDATMPADLARAASVKLKDLPGHAPGWAVMEAPDAFAALAAMHHLRDAGHDSADVLLAVQHDKRAMPNDPLIAQQWHLANNQGTRTHINIESAWNYPSAGARGTGVRIGIIDDGLQTAHPDLSVNVDTANDRDWNGNDQDPNPGSGDDHGTACAGNAAARGNNALGVAGSAPEATLVGLRLIAASVTDAQEAEAMAWKNDIIQIKSNSWGPSDTGSNVEGPGPLTAAALQDATTNGRGGRGTIILWAGGNGGLNDNSNYDGYANSIHTIAIGASDSNGNRASYSEPGANLVVVAPSSGSKDITTTDRTGTAGYSNGDYTNSFGGTSSATPTAAGVVALMLEKKPSLGWRDVQEILIRSAFKLKPTDTGWSNNSAGIAFNHNFGAGLIDAAAAVSLAAEWTNLPPQQSSALTQSNSSAIPDNNPTGITRSFDFSATNLRVEHVTVRLNINHTYRGDLAITLTSPGGMTSRLAEKRTDSNNNYANWTFSSVRHWGENASGIWTLRIADLSSGDTGSLTAATVTLHGATSAPVNPPPLARIASPQNGAIFSPGADIHVEVDASDLTETGSPGEIARVELLLNNDVVATDQSAPWQFKIAPPPGDHTLVARATDTEGAVGSSASASITVANQPPVITAASLNAASQAYADEGLAVSAVTASDPENAPVSYHYQWQASTDGVSFIDVDQATNAALAPAPDRAGKLWRCVITADDGENTSQPFTTTACNLLNRPPSQTAAGSGISYSSGLILRGGGSILTRQAIINEFSQGPVGGAAEWIEILTLQNGSLAFWDIRDANDNTLVFLDDPVWDDIPAGTLIVIFNGTTTKDPLLPPDDPDPSDGRMVVSSTDARFFDPTYDAWPSLSNTGDSIFLSDADSNIVHQLAYGTSTAASPNIGGVGSGLAAYFNGGSDPAADLAENWSTSSSTTARSMKALLPGITLTGGTYSQNFNETPGPSGTTYPDGWTSYNKEAEDVTMVTGNAASTTGANYNYGSRIGLLGSGSNFDPSAIVLAIQNTTGLTNLTIDYEVIQIREQPRSMNFNLQYSLTSPTSGFEDIAGGSYISGSTAEGTITGFSVPLPAALNDRNSTIYLRWLYNTNSGAGNRDALAIDNVTINVASASPRLALSISPAIFAENAGSNAAVGTVSIPETLQSPLSIALASSDTSEATVPSSVVIPAGQTSTTFTIAAVDDEDPDGPQTVAINASANDYLPATFTLTVTDNEPSVTGVTPGNGNNPSNSEFITRLRSGSYGTPALYRLGTGSAPPVGLTLDPVTGLLAGTIDASNPAGNYPIIIERYNPQGEVVSTSFVLSVTSPTNDYASWIAGYAGQLAGQAGRADDPDGDGLPNAVENLLGTLPTQPNRGLSDVSLADGALIFHHTFADPPASDVTAAYQWSANLLDWHESGELADGIRVTFTTAVVNDNNLPGSRLKVTATVSGSPAARIFARLAAR